MFKDLKTQHGKDGNFSQIYLYSQCIPIKIIAELSVFRDKIILKFIWKDRGTRIAK